MSKSAALENALPPALPYRELGNPAAASEDERHAALQEILKADPAVMAILEAVRDLELPDAWLVSGGLYQTVWNVMTGRPHGHGIKDYDIIYFDGADTGYDAEDEVIRAVDAALPALAGKLETRNQARVHLWFEEKFGTPYPALTCSLEALTNYASKTHAVAARVTAEGGLETRAPFGLANIFALRLVPNPMIDNRKTHLAKGKRQQEFWPDLTIEPWPA